jgi:hypothetical protein
MFKISVITLYYITYNISPEEHKDIFTSFSLLDNFGIDYYEDKYVNLINNTDIGNDVKQGMIKNYLRSDVYSIIKDHGILVRDESESTLYDLNEIAHFLYILQKLEDYTLILHMLTSDASARTKMVNLIANYSIISVPRIYDIIGEVSDNFIDNLIKYIEEKEQQSEGVDDKHIKHIKYFFEFIENTTCLGYKLYNAGYVGMTLIDLVNISKIDFAIAIDEVMKTNLAQAALDCLSILMICVDSYEVPVLRFKQNTHNFTNTLENVTKLEAMMLSIMNDFYMFLQVKKEQENLNG